MCNVRQVINFLFYSDYVVAASESGRNIFGWRVFTMFVVQKQFGICFNVIKLLNPRTYSNV